MKIVGIVQPTQCWSLLKKEMGELFGKVVWIVCRDDGEALGAPDFGIIHSALEREKPDIIIGFGRLVQEKLSKDFQGYGTLIYGPPLPDLTWFEQAMGSLRSRLEQQLSAPPATNEPESCPF